MNKRWSFLALFLIFSTVSIILMSCANNSATIQKPARPSMHLTQTSDGTEATQIIETDVIEATDTSAPTFTQTELPATSSDTPVILTNTLTISSSTGEPTNTPTVTPTFTPSLTPTRTASPFPCNIARLVAHITIPDGSIIPPGEAFTKTWRFQNVGTCTWTTDYDLVYITGDLMGAEVEYPLTDQVRPGETIDISIDLVAPLEKGTYAGHWMLRNESGGRFGTGTYGTVPFWVGINVLADVGEVFDFTRQLCTATWNSGFGTYKVNLPCPGKESDFKNGFAVKKDYPVREDGGVENERGMITHPNNIPGGYIRGSYPIILVKDNYVFKALINCQDQSDECDVTFELRYIIGTAPEKSLGRWHQSYDGDYEKIVVDLAPLVGNYVKFVLYVETRNGSMDDNALWIRPSIWDTSKY